MKNLSSITFFLICAFGVPSLAQHKPASPGKVVKTDPKMMPNGQVPNSGVFNMRQDRNGNIWMATNDGVYRYDGKSFAKITGKVSSARASAVLEDRNGNLWFTTLGSGIFKYDGKSFMNFTTSQGLASNHAICIYEDRKGNIWFGTPVGAVRYDGKSFYTLKMNAAASAPDSVHASIYEKPLAANSSFHNNIHAIAEDKTGKLWFGTSGNTFLYDGKTFTTLRNKEGKAFTNVWCITADKKGNVWFGADGLWRYGESSLTKISQTDAGVLVQDKKGNIMASLGGTISRYEVNTLSDPNPHRTEINQQKGYRKNLPFGLLGAKDGSIWFASGGGVSRYDGNTITRFESKP